MLNIIGPCSLDPCLKWPLHIHINIAFFGGKSQLNILLEQKYLGVHEECTQEESTHDKKLIFRLKMNCITKLNQTIIGKNL
jgi:hypothetical protein